jgi:hypothetical protein
MIRLACAECHARVGEHVLKSYTELSTADHLESDQLSNPTPGVSDLELLRYKKKIATFNFFIIPWTVYAFRGQ